MKMRPHILPYQGRQAFQATVLRALDFMGELWRGESRGTIYRGATLSALACEPIEGRNLLNDVFFPTS